MALVHDLQDDLQARSDYWVGCVTALKILLHITPSNDSHFLEHSLREAFPFGVILNQFERRELKTPDRFVM